MTKEEIDIMWQKAMQESIKYGEMFTRYHFAKLVAEKEREACAKVCDEYADDPVYCGDAIRARGQA
jgi:hypothetical protein